MPGGTSILNSSKGIILETYGSGNATSADWFIHELELAINNGKNGEILVQKSPSTSITTLVEAIKKLTNRPKHPVINIGVRHGEKTYESLLSKEELSKAISKKKYFVVPPDFRDLNYEEYFEIGKKIKYAEDYNSNNTKKLSLDETVKILKSMSILDTIE